MGMAAAAVDATAGASYFNIWTALVVVFVTIFLLSCCTSSAGPRYAGSDRRTPMSIPESRKIKGSTADFQEDLPKDGVFTLETLMRWDGLERPMCVGVCGKVHDVSSSENFEPEMGYGKLWGGKDATHALATASLADDAANNLNWSLEGLEEEHRESLKSWCAHFTGKYPVVGTLNEYTGWDFGPVATPAAAADATGALHPVQTEEEAGDAGN